MLEYLPILQGLGSALFGNQALRQSTKRTPAEMQNEQLSNALSNPENPLFKRYQAQETDSALQDYQMGLQDLITANRRQSALGRTPLFDPERGGEDIWRATQLGRVSAGQQGTSAARQDIMNAINANRGASQVQRNRQETNAIGDYRFSTGIADAILPYLQKGW